MPRAAEAIAVMFWVGSGSPPKPGVVDGGIHMLAAQPTQVREVFAVPSVADGHADEDKLHGPT